jgi:hypothetical protein
MAKKFDIVFTLNGKKVGINKFNEIVRSIPSRAVSEEFWRKAGAASLSQFIKKQQKKVQEDLINSIAGQWWQYQWEETSGGGFERGGKVPGGGASPSPWNSGTPLWKLIKKIPITFERTQTKSGFTYEVSLDLSEINKESEASSNPNSKAFAYWLTQEFGLSDGSFDGKHFIFNEAGTDLNSQNKKVLDKFVERINTRIRSHIRSRRRKGK